MCTTTSAFKRMPEEHRKQSSPSPARGNHEAAHFPDEEGHMVPTGPMTRAHVSWTPPTRIDAFLRVQMGGRWDEVKESQQTPSSS